MGGMSAGDYFTGKKVTLMRIGLLGRGVGDAAYLARAGAEVLVVDSAPQEVMQPSVDALKGVPNISFKFGPYDLADFRDCDLVLKGSGTPLDAPEIAEARAHGVPVRMSADLFAELSGVPAIGITGTRGKSTTTHMIASILEAAGKEVLLGGNVRGVSTLALLDAVNPEKDQVAVLELDSWQLQGFGEAKLSPHISVFTTFFPDHLNYYHGDLDAYLADKANIFLNQMPDDLLILGSQCAGVIQDKYQERFGGRFEVWGEADLPKEWKLKIPGAHNRYDAALALAAARAYGVADEDARRGLESFGGVKGRLEFVAEKGGVKVYNDNNSTTPDATIVGLRAVGTEGKRTVVLIMGGDEKHLDMDALIEEIPRWCSKVVLFKERGTDRVRDEVFALAAQGVEVFEEEGLEATVRRAFLVATSGETILYSPAFSSFGKYFKNEYDRGDQFDALVHAL